MTTSSHLFLFSVLLIGVFWTSLTLAKKEKLRSGNFHGQLPHHYALYVVSWCFFPTTLVFLLDRFLYSKWMLEAGFSVPWAEQLGSLVLTLCAFILGGLLAIYKIRNLKHNVRAGWERFIKIFLVLASTCAVTVTFGVVLSLLFEAMRFFQSVSASEFFLGVNWSPQTSIREDQIGSSGSFGSVPLFVGTLVVSLVAIFVAAPIGLLTAIYLNEYASSRLRSTVKPLLEILAGIPTVVYGFFAALIVAPLLHDFFLFFNIDASTESALAAGSVMGIMLIPFICSLSDDAINMVPDSLREGSLSLGATHSEMIRTVVLPAANTGIVGGFLLAISRAIGETMIVVMAAGLAANLTWNPLETMTTVTVQIVSILVGDQSFDSPKTLAAFALGLTLFLITLFLNFVAFYLVKHYRERHA